MSTNKPANGSTAESSRAKPTKAPTAAQFKSATQPTFPKKATQKHNQTALIIAFVVGLVLLIASMIVAHDNTLSGWQASLFRDFNNMHNGLTTPAKWITEGLGAAYPIAACVIIALLFKKYRLAWRFFFTAGGALAVATVIKYIVNEPRPYILLHNHLHQRAVETGPGFPSNHATAATALALTLWFILPVKWRWVSVLWILLVVWSRLYLGVHTPADVVAGFGIGLMAVCFVRLLPKPIAEWLKLDEK